MRVVKILILIGLSVFSMSTYGQGNGSSFEDDSDMIYKEVEEFPLFAGCDYSDMNTVAEKKACSDEKLIQYISSNLKYPRKARKKGIEGRVFVQFVVGADGAVRDEKIVKEIGGNCGDEVLKLVRSFPKWIPGKLNGKPVSVLYTIPVNFALPKKKK